jgi:hypothetical protein
MVDFHEVSNCQARLQETYRGIINHEHGLWWKLHELTNLRPFYFSRSMSVWGRVMMIHGYTWIWLVMDAMDLSVI